MALRFSGVTGLLVAFLLNVVTPVAAADIQVLSWYWQIDPNDSAMVVARGEIRNVGDDDYGMVVARVRFYDKQDRFLTEALGTIGVNQFPPGATEAFSAITYRNPAMSTARLSFRTFEGRPLESIASE